MGDGSVVAYDSVSGEEIEVLTSHAGVVICISVSYDAGIVVSGSSDNTVRVCGGIGGSEEERRAHRARGVSHRQDVRDISLLKGDETFVSGSFDQTLRVWDLECNCLRVVQVGEMIWSLALSPCGSQVAVGQGNGSLVLFETDTWDKVWEKKVYECDTSSVSFHGRYIATASFYMTANILDSETGRVIKSLEKGHSDRIHHVSFTPCGTSLLTASWDIDKSLLKWPLFPKETRALASFFFASGIETLLYEVFNLASREIILRIKRVLYLKMEQDKHK